METRLCKETNEGWQCLCVDYLFFASNEFCFFVLISASYYLICHKTPSCLSKQQQTNEQTTTIDNRDGAESNARAATARLTSSLSSPTPSGPYRSLAAAPLRLLFWREGRSRDPRPDCRLSFGPRGTRDVHARQVKGTGGGGGWRAATTFGRRRRRLSTASSSVCCRVERVRRECGGRRAYREENFVFPRFFSGAVVVVVVVLFLSGLMCGWKMLRACAQDSRTSNSGHV